MNVVYYECGLLGMWFIMNVVCYECGLLWTGLFLMWSVMNGSVLKMVCNERVCYERQKWWTKVSHCTIHLKPKKAGQNSNAEVSTEKPVPDLFFQINNNWNLNAKCRRCNNVKQWKDTSMPKNNWVQKNSCATSSKEYKQKQ